MFVVMLSTVTVLFIPLRSPLVFCLWQLVYVYVHALSP